MTPQKETKREPRNWPRLTPKQKEILADFENGKPRDLHFSGQRSLNTAWILKEHGMLIDGTTNVFQITQRGRDYLRFGTRKRKAVKP